MFLRLREGSSYRDLEGAVRRVAGVAEVYADADDRALVTAKPGWIFDSPGLPPGGFHGGESTRRTVAVVAGGHPAVAAIARSIAERPPALIDWAPTIAVVLGLDAGVMEGRPLSGPAE